MKFVKPAFVFAILSGCCASVSFAADPVQTGSYALGSGCTARVTKQEDGVYEFRIDRANPPMYHRVTLNLADHTVVSGPNTCGQDGHPSAKVEFKQSQDWNEFRLKCGGRWDVVDGISKLVLSKKTGRIELSSIQFSSAAFSLSNSVHSGPWKSSSDAFICFSGTEGSLRAVVEQAAEIRVAAEAYSSPAGSEGIPVSYRSESGKPIELRKDGAPAAKSVNPAK